jgi:hypothetical protein
MGMRLFIRRVLLSGAVACSGFAFQAVCAQNAPSGAADQDLAALLKQLEQNIAKNEKIAQQYASDVIRANSVSNSKGKVISHHSDKLELVFIEGLAYMRRIEEDGRPLSAKKEKASQKLLDGMRDLGKDYEFIFELVGEDPHSYIYSGLPICCLDSSFDNRVLRHDVIDGRDNIVIESTPRANATPASEHEKTALYWKETTWIDVKDRMPTRYDAELVNDLNYLTKGTTTSIEFMRMEAPATAAGNPDQVVWLVHRSAGHLGYLWRRKPTWCTSEEELVNYRKFRSDMRMVDNSVREVPSQGSTTQQE